MNPRPRLPRFWVYLLLGDDGTVYCGFTGNLRRRFREHNDPDNRGYTRGRRWHLLAVRCFLDHHSALLLERQLKVSRYDKGNWIKRERSRLRRLCHRYGIEHRLA